MRRFAAHNPWGRGASPSALAASRQEWLLIAATCLAAVLLNVSATNQTIGIALVGCMCLFSLSSPLPAMVALGASQVVADPAGLPLTLAQCLFVAWVGHWLVGRKRVDYRSMRVLLLWVLPYLIVAKALNYMKWGEVLYVDSFDLAVLVGVMAAWYVGQLRGRILLGVLCVAVSASPSVMTYWLHVAGVATEGMSADKGIGVASIGLGRGDGNFSGISISLAALSFLAFGMLAQQHIWRSRARLGLVPCLCMGFFLASIPPVFATMSRGAVLTFFGGLAFVIVAALYATESGGVRVIAFGVLSSIVGVVAFKASEGLADQYVLPLWEFSANQMGNSLMMSRAETWGAAFQELSLSPLIGTTPETQVSTIQYGYAYCSHNVWLDVGRGSGVPGMLWFTAFFFYPLFGVFRRCSKSDALILCCPFVILLLVFMNLSVINLKVFYEVWVLAVAAAQAGGRMDRERAWGPYHGRRDLAEQGLASRPESRRPERP